MNLKYSYKEIAQILNCNSKPLIPAELHGFICGIICGGNHSENEAGFHLILNYLDDENLLSKTAKETAAHLMLHTFQQLQNANFDFQLLLPEDDQPISLQTQALATWCQSFLGGLGISGIRAEQIKKSELSEALHDIAEISKLKYDENDSGKAAEAELLELTEYVKVAVLLFYTEIVGKKTKTTKQPLH